MSNGRKKLPVSQRYISDRIESHEISVMVKPETFHGQARNISFWCIGILENR